MLEKSISAKIEQLKKEIHDNVSVNDNIVCTLCDELIFHAKEIKDWQSTAFGHVWKADYFFYVDSNINDMLIELNLAKKYIDKKNPSELLEKFYTLQHLFCENSFDIYSSFQYCLKALGIAEQLHLSQRICANYGNLGTYFLDYECYEEAFLYTDKSLNIMRTLPDKNPRMLRLILTNLILIHIRLGRLEYVRPLIKELTELPIEEKDLKPYVDYSYLHYHSAVADTEKSLYYLEEMFQDGLMNLPSRAYIVELLTNALKAMIQIRNKEKSLELFHCLQSIIKENEPEPLLVLCRLKIQFSQEFETKQELYLHYQEYYHRYIDVQNQINQLKAEGIRSKIALNDSSFAFDQSKEELAKLQTLVYNDELTKVYNRSYMNIKRNEIINSTDYACIGIVIFDIDYFKEYNDFYGHIAGDTVLIQVADCIQSCATEPISTFRYGGDEFVCFCPGMDADSVKAFITQVRTTLKAKNIEHRQSQCSSIVTLSIGYGVNNVKTDSKYIVLFNQVDEALYLSKKRGRNQAKSIWDLNYMKGEADA